MRPDKADHHVDEPPPILGAWSRLYAVVIGALAIQILIFYLFTRAFT